ncbi:fumarylacetoacetate hydrolase family protein [Asanoa sp. WMMD1127]|uniref:fumarylacetoacetate hydrolase family protein n=1 Tax=Asanoa sp. WMMD1127 TaxID=3016107 RepID=UPI0024167DB2|nr:fumarylacetoacetate hydrolase family protein [Asanoa sp. WMMD1127]MDG4825788.1 fumarylacetoacetate hydrolase family protein [Asanoa sp. WMMD1127]
MHIVRYRREHDETARVGVRVDGVVRELPVPSVAALLREPVAAIRTLLDSPGDEVGDARLLAPVDGATEVWAAGVTYLRSREARMEESSEADIYGRVYEAPRPELFFKSAAWRVVVDGDPVAIRADSGLDVPEPELALVVNRLGEIAGYLVCNDMSSRAIEGENPLYLPQAKVYAGACALSAGIRPAWEVDGADLPVAVRVTREGVAVWSGATSTARIKRPLQELVDWLFRADNFPDGAVLSTGTGLAPAMDFTLQPDDVVTITIDGVGELTNPVVVGKEHFAFQHP